MILKFIIALLALWIIGATVGHGFWWAGSFFKHKTHITLDLADFLEVDDE